MEGLQDRLHEWRKLNFPEDTETSLKHQMLGIVEEVGELAHAILKREQGIRGTQADHEAAEQDAVGDLLIFLAGYCSYRGWHMRGIYERTAVEVMKRDWVNYPDTGFPPIPTDFDIQPN